MSTKTVFSSDGTCLRFPDDDLYEEYRRKEELLVIQTYKAVRDKYGVWASNQGKFVRTRADLTSWDSKIMENLLDKYLEEEHGQQDIKPSI